jgi:uncharacterized protein YodC (DUF2158 family)
MTFEPGEVVMLKSGGHSMTVASVSDDEITCLWTSESGEFFREIIPAVALESVFSDLHDDDDKEDDDDEDKDDDDEDDDDDDDDDDEDEKPKSGSRKRA